MLSIFNRKQSTANSFSFLGVDLHSHLIPGIDDGARTVEESLSLISGLQELGFEHLITTPHIMQDYYPNTFDSINNGLDLLHKALAPQVTPPKLTAAAEYYGDEYLIFLLDADAPLMKIDKKHVLFEVSMLAESPFIKQIIFKLKTKGYSPILAHPERYLYYKKNINYLKELDCVLQVNLLSLAGYYGSEQKRMGEQLIESSLVQFLATDIHHENQLPYLASLARDKKMMKLLHRASFRNIELM